MGLRTKLDFLGISGLGLNPKVFSQLEFRKKYLSDFPYPLCSALTETWIQSKLENWCFQSKLDEPTEEFLQMLSEKQAKSYYPSIVQPISDLKVEAEHAKLLTLKYGTSDLKDLFLMLEKAHAPDFLSFDLLKTYRFSFVKKYGFNRIESSFFDLVFRKEETISCHIIVLRYLSKTKKKIVRKSHRIAIFYQSGVWSFFDPNHGFIEFETELSAIGWFSEFWNSSAYVHKTASPFSDLITLYQLHE